jgi:hypothetical protein
MNISIQSSLKNISIVTLCSLSGSIMWHICKDVYSYQIYSIRTKNKHFLTEIKDMINFNFGTFFGFSLGISYIYTGRPFIYYFYELDKNID